MFNVFSWILAIFYICGSYFNAKKSVVGFYIWGLCAVFWMVIDINREIYGRAFLDFVHLCFALWGIHNWKFKK